MCIKKMVGLLLVFLFSGLADAELRTWTTKDGQTFEAEFEREFFGTLFLKDADQLTVRIDLENLSGADVHYLRTVVVPEVDVSVSKRSQVQERSPFAQGVNISTLTTATVKIFKKGRAPFCGTLRGELYIVGEEVATDDYRMVLIKKFPIRFIEKNEGVFTIETTAKSRRFQDAVSKANRGVEYYGYVVVITDEQGKVFHIEKNIGWIEEESIPSFRELPEGSFFNKYCFEVPTPRQPAYERSKW